MMDHCLLEDVVDHEILMHREVHFASSFDLMIKSYLEESKAACAPFDVERIEALKQLQETLGQDLATTLLSEDEKEKIKKHAALYQQFQALFENKNASSLQQAIADLILGEEWEMEEEIKKLASFGKEAAPPLIEILSNDLFYDSLSPGYGQAPYYAARVLGLIKDPSAIKPLFEALDKNDHEFEADFIAALTEIGDSAKEFLLKVFNSKPFTKDNEKALVALLSLPEEDSVCRLCLEQLLNQSYNKKFPYILYLILGCSGLKRKEDKEAFEEYFKNSDLPLNLKEEMSLVIKHWN